MVVHAAKSLPPAEEYLFVAQKEHCEKFPIESEIQKHIPNSKIIQINELTDGQAITVSLGLKDVERNKSLMIASSDNGMIYDFQKLQTLTENTSIDGIVFTFQNYPLVKENPQMYGWVIQENNQVKGVSVKKPISENPIKDQAIVGAFYFRTVEIYYIILQQLIQKNIRVNNEFYVDSMVGLGVELGYNFVSFPVDYYICWGTPNDYKTYLYWQEAFHKVNWHPYKKK